MLIESAARTALTSSSATAGQGEPSLGALLVGLAFLLGGGFLVTIGVLFRAGELRQLARNYDRDDLPYYSRNLSLGLIPSGVGGIGLGIGSLLLYSGDTGSGKLALAVGVCGCVASALLMRLAPDWIKPAWMNEADRTT